jgi:hypothetical protein
MKDSGRSFKKRQLGKSVHGCEEYLLVEVSLAAKLQKLKQHSLKLSEQ